ncbi:alpha/beta hydrolase [Pseudoclavibacter chungangensis]|uniref:Alpha/beta hydrolase n=1 Tax=Pseudoclavibacter chungangensis TaxID=587635 RepID=A0A7J5BNN9_9MICO|nr:alpha/beta fold hydrolase [Pseudoclavibacter chungangensis]KAB1654034.1 alpha/beta hydrolase [Pseudoclavibacter chungangensis]NYJ66059.1 pimeloyl-ACP methyl ester carboxylesterase [Pseudoclavibacter chungangensis]
MRTVIGAVLRGIARSSSGLRHVRRPAVVGAPEFDLAYLRTGPRSRHPIVVVPGGPGLASTLPYRDLRRRATRLGLDLIMIEHRGIGLSRTDTRAEDLPASAMRIEAVLDDIAAVLDREDVESAIVYGASYGSYLAQGFGVRHPTRVHAMILDSPILSTRDHLVERELVRDLLLRGASPGTARPAAAIRRLLADGEDPIDLLCVTRAAYELGGHRLLDHVLALRLRGVRGLAWRVLDAYAGRGAVAGAPIPCIYEFDLVGTIAFREMRYGPDPDGEPFDPTQAYAALAPDYEQFAGEPFDLEAELPRFVWPVVVMTGHDDLRTPPSIARRVAGLLPDAVLLEIAGGHSTLESHPLAALRVMDRTRHGERGALHDEVPVLDRLPRRGLSARLPEIVDAAARIDRLVARLRRAPRGRTEPRVDG